MVEQDTELNKPAPKMMISRWNSKGTPLSPRILRPSEDPEKVMLSLGFRKKIGDDLWRNSNGFTARLHEASIKKSILSGKL